MRSPLLAIAATILAGVVAPFHVSALTCAREWGDDTLAGARGAVEGTAAGWADGLLIGTIVSVEHYRDDPGRAAAVTVDPEVSFDGPFRERARFEIGGHGPLINFTAGSRYLLVLHRSTDPAGWFLDPCGPTLEITHGGQLQELRAAAEDEVIIDQPSLPSAPQVPWVPAILGLVAVGLAAWLFRRRARAVHRLAR
jgi:hypothetical protein